MAFNWGTFSQYAGKAISNLGNDINEQEKNRIARDRQASIDMINAMAAKQEEEKNSLDIAQKQGLASDTLAAKPLLGQLDTAISTPLLSSTGMPNRDLTPAEFSQMSAKPDVEPQDAKNWTSISPLAQAEGLGLNSLQNVPAVKQRISDLTAQQEKEDQRKSIENVSEKNREEKGREFDLKQQDINLKKNELNYNKKLASDAKEQERQDRLEKQAHDNISNLRGDRIVSEVEKQRDAAINAYGIIIDAEKNNTELNPVQYGQVLRLLNKANGIGEALSSEAEQATLKGKFGQAFTLVTGQQAPATSADIMKSLKDQVIKAGLRADSTHESYMPSHKFIPSGLDKDRADRITKLGRGTSFADFSGTQASNSTQTTDDDIIAKYRKN